MGYLENLPYIDMDRAVLAGASYGGYMLSWMFGHDIIRKFSCTIWHDGIYNLPAFLIMTDISCSQPDFNGAPFSWVNTKDLEAWNPARPERLAKWKNVPPTLVIHSEKDYRCPITEGLAAFKTLQSQGVTSRFLTFPDECHFVLNPENALVWNKTVFEWMDKFAKSK